MMQTSLELPAGSEADVELEVLHQLTGLSKRQIVTRIVSSVLEIRPWGTDMQLFLEMYPPLSKEEKK